MRTNRFANVDNSSQSELLQPVLSDDRQKAICFVSLSCDYEKLSLIQGGLEGRANAPEDNPYLPTLKKYQLSMAQGSRYYRRQLQTECCETLRKFRLSAPSSGAQTNPQLAIHGQSEAAQGA
eukprot:6179722-Pleurochrysis_carterae.AAC.1